MWMQNGTTECFLKSKAKEKQEKKSKADHINRHSALRSIYNKMHPYKGYTVLYEFSIPTTMLLTLKITTQRDSFKDVHTHTHTKNLSNYILCVVYYTPIKPQ